MTTEEYEPTYWTGKGTFQKEINVLYHKYIKKAKRGSILKTDSNEANKVLRQLMTLSNKYQRFYNDGDSFTFNKYRFASNNKRTFSKQEIEKMERKLDQFVDETIIKAWAATQKATLPIVEVD